MGSSVSIQYGKGQATNSDDAVGGSAGASSWDFALTNGGLYEGLNVGLGYGEIANASAGDAAASSDDTDAHYTAFATYTFGAITAGYQQSVVENNTTGGADEEATAWSVAANVMDGLSVSYGEREVEFMNPSAAHITEDMEGVAVAYTSDDKATGAETTYWGVNGYYTFDLASLSVGFETEETSGTDKSGYFVGLTFPEVGPGSVSLGLGTQANYADNVEELLTYEASYSYAINDGMTITPGVYISEGSGTADDDTGVLVKTSFSF
mgnify:CR=1 FL=1